MRGSGPATPNAVRWENAATERAKRMTCHALIAIAADQLDINR
jgi:hypothetical protein